jgi:hypothetical protein
MFCISNMVFLFGQDIPRLVLPIGHSPNKMVKSEFSSRGNYLFSYEDSIFIVWDGKLQKELYRKEFSDGTKLLGIMVDSEESYKVMLRSVKDQTENLLIIDYLHNQIINLPHVTGKHVIHPENTSLLLVGNKDSVQVLDTRTYKPITKLGIDIWRLNQFKHLKSRSGKIMESRLEYFIYPDSDLATSLYLYDENQRVTCHHLPFSIHKAVMLDSIKVLVQKTTKDKNANDYLTCQMYDLNTGIFSDPIPFHKYHINQVTHGLHGEFLSIGNDGRLVKWDQHMRILAERNVKKEFRMPSLNSIYLDTFQKVISFQAVLKCQKPQEQTDSLWYEGRIDYNSLELISVNKRNMLAPTNWQLTDSLALQMEDNVSFLYGKDVPFFSSTNVDQIVEINDRYARIDHFQKITFPVSKESEKNLSDITQLTNNQLLSLADSLLVQKTSTTFHTAAFLKDLKKRNKKFEAKKNKKISKNKWKIVRTTDDQSRSKIEQWLRQLDSSSYEYQLLLERWGANSRWTVEDVLSLHDEQPVLSHSIPIHHELTYRGKRIYQSFTNKLFIQKTNHFTLLVEKKTGANEAVANIFHIQKGCIKDTLYEANGDMEILYPNEWFTEEDDFVGSNPIFITYPKCQEHERIIDLESWLYPYPNRRVQLKDSISGEHFFRNEEWYQVREQKDGLRLVRVDSIQVTDFLSKEAPSFLKGPTYPIFKHKETSIDLIINPINFRNGQSKLVYKTPGVQKFFLSTFTPNIASLQTQNTISVLGNLMQFSNDIKAHHVEYEYLTKRLYSNVSQLYLRDTIELSEQEVFIDADTILKTLLLYNSGNGFFEVRDFHHSLLYSIILMENHNYLIVDPDYRFDGTPGAIQQLYFVCGLEVIELDQVKDSLYVPNLAQRIMNGEKLQHLPTLTDLNICGVTPVIEPLEEDTSGNKYYLISPRSGGIGEIEVYINGVVRLYTHAQKLPQKDGRYLLQIDKELWNRYRSADESLHIKVIAKTANNSIRSRGVVLDYETERLSTFKKPSIHAVMIGIDDYAGEALDMNYAAKDAIDLERSLQKAAQKFFNIDDTNRVFFYSLTRDKNGTLKGLTPDKGNIFKVLQTIESSSKPEDVFLLFFAGHGEIVDKDQLLLLTAESSRETFEGIRMQELLEQMKNIPANKRVLILDACHSGAAINNLDLANITGKRDISEAERQSQRMKELDKLASKSGFAIITAASSEQEALELPQFEHGIMTYALLHTMLNNPDALDENKQLQLEKWLLATEEEVRKLNPKQSAERMVPLNFALGKVDEEVRNTIQLKEIPAVCIQNVLNAELGWDDLSVESKILDFYVSNTQGKEKPFLLVHEGFSNAFTTNILYKKNRNNLAFKVTILKNANIHNQFTVHGHANKLADLIQRLVREVDESLK